ncbi:MAG: 4-(cytidine 5'-diphospho)-2-C-methyl-D-erythritol kinase [Clostridia bacterium]|nr:4-(cytidine 5'-diphospho)-2-C-methyl-D-erythritol kinase [Clostridia bacterium]
MKLSILSPAKINLYLDVLNKRSDGYHNIQSIMQTVSLYDEIFLNVSESTKISNEISIFSDNTAITWDKSNLVYKSAEKFLASANISFKKIVFEVKKSIPICAGMAGGSADAAAVLKLLNHAFNYPLSTNELLSLGATLGADVPFCILGGTYLCEGIGERLTKLPTLKDVYLVCVMGNEPKISTAHAYSEIDKKYGIECTSSNDIDKIINAISAKNISKISSLLFNKFEEVSSPEVYKIKALLLENGALGSLMSGSGPSVFGIFEDEESAKTAFLKICSCFNKVFLCKTV